MAAEERPGKRPRQELASPHTVEQGGSATHDSPDPVLTLDVGGTLMKTRQGTLTGSSVYFNNLFNGPFKTENQHLFVDCDPAIFIHVLHYFRYHRYIF